MDIGDNGSYAAAREKAIGRVSSHSAGILQRAHTPWKISPPPLRSLQSLLSRWSVVGVRVARVG